MRQVHFFTNFVIIAGLVILSSAVVPHNASAEITAVIIVAPTEGLITDEKGGSDSFTVELDSPPLTNITIDFSSSDPTEGFVSPEKLTINPGNWNKPDQNVITVTGVADGIEDGDIVYEITGTASSGDPVPTVSVTNLNNPVPIANDDHPPINGYSPIIIPVLDNDTALNDIPIDITVTSDPSFGSYGIDQDQENTITYTPSEAFLGLDQFTYQICDLDGDCSSADVIIEDQIPPEIISVSPVGIGDSLEVTDDEITIEVEVADNFQVDCVEFIRWDAISEQYIDLGQDCLPAYQIVIVKNSLNFGWNQIYIRAIDIAGNSSQYEFIWLYRINRIFIPLVASP